MAGVDDRERDVEADPDRGVVARLAEQRASPPRRAGVCQRVRIARSTARSALFTRRSSRRRRIIGFRAVRTRLHPRPRPPLRLDRAAQPARLPRGGDQRGDGLRAGGRRLLLLRHPRGRLAEPLVQRPHGAARGELRRADRGGAGAAHLRGGRRRRPGRRPGRASTRAGPRSCSPTSTTSTTTATRPTSPATRWSSPATTRRSPCSPTPASRSCRRPGSRTSTGPATAATPPTRSPATCSPRRPRASTASGCGRRSRRRSSGRRRRCSSPSSASSPASTPCAASPRRPAAGPRSPRTGSWCARFGYQVIERRGTGGGAFRLMYSRFLEEAGRPEAPLAAAAAARWTELAGAFHAASESEDPEPLLWRAVDDAAARRLRGRAAPLDLARRGLSAGRDDGRGRHDPARRPPARARRWPERRCGCGRRIPAAGRPGSSGSTG